MYYDTYEIHAVMINNAYTNDIHYIAIVMVTILHSLTHLGQWFVMPVLLHDRKLAYIQSFKTMKV